MPEQFIVTSLEGGPGYTWNDKDLWGLECALQHALIDNYFESENAAWARNILRQLAWLRGREAGDQEHWTSVQNRR